jgi:hypothetical protein
MFDTNRGTDLVLEHHSIHVTHTQYRFPQSHDRKQHPQKCFSKHGIYQLPICMGTYFVHSHIHQLNYMYLIWERRQYSNAWVPPYTRPTHPVSLPTGKPQRNVCSHSFMTALFRLLHTCTWYVPVHTHTDHTHTSFPIMHDHPCYPHESDACPSFCWQNHAYLKSPRWAGHPGEACHVQTAAVASPAAIKACYIIERTGMY